MLSAMETQSWSASSSKTERIDLLTAYCFLAEQYELGIAEFEKTQLSKNFKLKAEPKPRHIGYAYCLHKARGQFSDEELFEAGKRMLDGYLQDEWIAHGNYTEPAMWLKIIYGQQDPTLTPEQTMLKAYNHMPDVSRPDFLDE